MSTVEDFTALRIDHVAVVDFDGFREISEALGGVTVQVPGGGPKTLGGDAALEYVRERKSLPNGDFDRIQRQQNILRAIFADAVVGPTRRRPSKNRTLANTVERRPSATMA